MATSASLSTSPAAPTTTPAASPTPSVPKIPPGELLAAKVQTIDDAVQVVEHEVQRQDIFDNLRTQGLLAMVDMPDPQGSGTVKVQASNIFDPDKFKNIDLQGVDASQIQFVDTNGNPEPLATFVLKLSDQEAKQFFQGTVYDDNTRFSPDDTQNTDVHNFLKTISSNYNGSSSLTEIKALVEPASTRCAALLSSGAGTGASATPAAASSSGTGLPTPHVAPAAGVWQITTPSSSSTPANSAPSAATGAAGTPTPAGNQPTGTPVAGATSSSVIASPNSGSALGGSSTTSATFKQVMDALANLGDEDAQVRSFITLPTPKERLDLIRSLADIVADQVSSRPEKDEAARKGIALVTGWLTDSGCKLAEDVLQAQVAQLGTANPAGAGSGSAAAAGSAPVTPTAAAAPSAAAATPAGSAAPAPAAQSAATTPANPPASAGGTTSP